ncbi:MAG TPA: M20/M25/M40 family metallo-hydrolase [Bryobacteraceae bacterium]|nr:M20/M25/M40 family metallo-hydrolase [Bryobacteraceae bacterium]
MRKLLGALALSCLVFAQGIDDGANAKIRKEEAEHSQLMHTIHMLADRYGPRMTGTPNHEAAVDWVMKQFTEWGMKNAHREAWDFARNGWLNERASGFIVSPVRQNLKFEVVAWTPSTKGTVTGSVVQLELPQGPMPPAPATDANAAPAGRRGGGGARGGGGGFGGPQRLGPTKDELNQWMEANKAKINGKVVMLGKAAVVAVNFNPPALRRPDDQVKQSYDPNNPNAGRGGFGGGGGRGRGGNQDPNRMNATQVAEAVDAWLLANGALVRLSDSAMDHGIIRVAQHRGYDSTKTIAEVMLRNDDYGRIERLLADGEDVKTEFNIVNHEYPEGKTSYNVVGEIPGTDKADEIVMLGGHLDSWHSATGATDNGIGSAIMMEAARIIQSLGLKPRRTIRVALWSGEEEGLLGSLAYVKQHFGTFEDPKPEFAKLDCYFNVDTGTGRVRGASVFGPPEAAAVLRRALDPFADLGVFGASATTSRATGGTDSTSFNNAGLAGIGFSQDPIEYNSVTHHTNLDTYERIVPEDVKGDAVVLASALWYVANLDQMIPRFAKDNMPAPVAAR